MKLHVCWNVEKLTSASGWKKKECADAATPINQVLVEGYYNQIKAISENLHIAVPTDWFQTLLRMPDVMTRTETQELSEEEWGIVYAAVKEAVSHLVDFRKQEGAALEKKFRGKNREYPSSARISNPL